MKAVFSRVLVAVLLSSVSVGVANANDGDSTLFSVINLSTSYDEIAGEISAALGAPISVVDISQTVTGAINNTKNQIMDALGTTNLRVKRYEIVLQHDDGQRSVCDLRLREREEIANAYVDHSVATYSLSATLEHCDGFMGKELPEGNLYLMLGGD